MPSDKIHISVVTYPPVNQLVMGGVNVLIVHNANRGQCLDWRAVEKTRVNFCQLIENLVFSLQPSAKTLRPRCPAYIPVTKANHLVQQEE